MARGQLSLLFAVMTVCTCFADTTTCDLSVQDVRTVIQESELATQTIVQDSKGGQIKILTTIRDTSWPSSLTYNPNSYYELVPQFYHDKITIREVKLGNLDQFYKTFCSVIKRQWNPASDVVTIWHYDLFDALNIGVQDANSAIVQAALEHLPFTKSVLPSGKTIDFMSGEPYIVNGKFKIDQFIELACDSMETRINKYRIFKFLSPVYATLSVAGIKGICQLVAKNGDLSAFEQYSKVSSAVGKKFFQNTIQGTEVTNKDLGISSDKSNQQEMAGNTQPVKDVLGADGSSKECQSVSKPKEETPSILKQNIGVIITAGLAVTSSMLSHRLQRIYVDGYIKTLDLLVSSDRVVFDHPMTYKKIKLLKDKLQWFGLANSRVERMQAILNKI